MFIISEQTRKLSVVKIFEDSIREVEDIVVVETFFHVFINRSHAFSVALSPENLELFLLGHLFCEDYIQCIDEIQKIEITGEKIEITLDRNFEIGKVILNKVAKMITSACGNAPDYWAEHKANSQVEAEITDTVGNTAQSKKIPEDVDYQTLLQLMKEFQKQALLFQDTGGVHSCALTDSRKLLFFAEDIGRHNAVDKVIGYALKHKILLEDKILFTTGRISSDILFKVLRTAIYGIVSKSAPTDQAVKIARKHKILLIGFARGNRCNVYSGYQATHIDSLNK